MNHPKSMFQLSGVHYKPKANRTPNPKLLDPKLLEPTSKSLDLRPQGGPKDRINVRTPPSGLGFRVSFVYNDRFMRDSLKNHI